MSSISCRRVCCAFLNANVHIGPWQKCIRQKMAGEAVTPSLCAAGPGWFTSCVWFDCFIWEFFFFALFWFGRWTAPALPPSVPRLAKVRPLCVSRSRNRTNIDWMNAACVCMWPLSPSVDNIHPLPTLLLRPSQTWHQFEWGSRLVSLAASVPAACGAWHVLAADASGWSSGIHFIQSPSGATSTPYLHWFSSRVFFFSFRLAARVSRCLSAGGAHRGGLLGRGMLRVWVCPAHLPAPHCARA